MEVRFLFAIEYEMTELELVKLTADIVSQLGKEIPSPHSWRATLWTLVGTSYRSDNVN